jgi:hypothetical protein
MVEGLRTMEKPGEIADLLASHIPQKWQEKQEFLEELDPLKRLERICAVLMRETDLADTEKEIQSRIRKLLDPIDNIHHEPIAFGGGRFCCTPAMGNSLVVKVHYTLGSRKC